MPLIHGIDIEIIGMEMKKWSNTVSEYNSLIAPCKNMRCYMWFNIDSAIKIIAIPDNVYR